MNPMINHRPVRSVDFKKVRDEVPIEWFFENVMGSEVNRTGGTIRFDNCPSASCGQASKKNNKVSIKDGKYKCFACNSKGDVVEAAAEYWGMEAKDAALKLMGVDPDMVAHYTAPKPRSDADRDDTALHEAIKLLVEASTPPNRAALNYFAGRGIGRGLVEEAVRRQLLVTLPTDIEACKQHLLDVVGKERLDASGLWREDQKAPAAAFRPLMFVSRGMTAAEFRVIKLVEDGEHKSLRYGGIAPWAFINKSQERVMLTEGAMDLMAALAMGTERSIIGLPGCENWRPEWFEKLKGRSVLTCFDSDNSGVAATEKITPHLIAAGAQVTHHQHAPGAKDLNEQLILSGPFVKLYFCESENSTRPYRDALLSLPGCDWWMGWQFGKIRGKHVKFRTGGGKVDDAAVHRLVEQLKRGGATVDRIVR